jgi:putative ABC transport system permease protein
MNALRRLHLLRDLPVAWLQLSHGRTKLLAAVVGIVFADLLMWMQLGFLNAAIESATSVHSRLRGEIVVLSPQSHQINASEPFPRRQLARAAAHPDVESVAPLYTGMVKWKDPWTGQKRPLFVYGIVPYAAAIGAERVIESAWLLNQADTCLFDLRSRPEFSGVQTKLATGEPLAAEINGRRVQVVGATSIGANFAVDGNLVTSDSNFLRLVPGRPAGSIDLGVIRLRPNTDIHRLKDELQAVYRSDLRVMSIPEFIEHEKDFMLRSRPINFIFSLGAAVGFLVGFAIVYQVLFTDVSHHLAQYATLKAIGYADRYLRGVVLHESLLLSVLGYVPGALLATALYAVTVKATHLPMRLTPERGLLIFGLTVAMCSLSGLLAMRKLQQADPADVF